MLKHLAAAAAFASALSLLGLAAVAALPAQDAPNGNRARPAPPTELPPAPELPPALPSPTPYNSSGAGVGLGLPTGGGTGSGGGRGLGPGTPAQQRAARDPLDFETPFAAYEVTQRVVITSKPEPGFTKEALKNDTRGFVRLRAVLTKDGRVQNISVVKGLPDGLTEEAIKAARRIKFRPAQVDGRLVSQYVMLEYNFESYDDGDKVERRAVILEQPKAEYTEEARRRKVEGTVVLEVVLYKDGTAGIQRVLDRLPHGLTEKAIEAAYRIKFTPAEDKGRKVSVVRRVEYVFSLD